MFEGLGRRPLCAGRALVRCTQPRVPRVFALQASIADAGFVDVIARQSLADFSER